MREHFKNLPPIAAIFALMVLGSCQQNKNEIQTEVIKEEQEFKSEECSIKLPNITFTKSVNGALQTSLIKNDVISITSKAKTDYFNEPDGSASYGSAPMLLSRIDNTNSFTFTTKVTPTFDSTYDAGAIYIYVSSKVWLKFAFELDERGNTRIVSVKTNDTSDDNNHERIDQRDVYLKITSDTKSIGFYYSTDNRIWNLARLYKNSYPDTLWLGISSQSPIGRGNTAVFEDLSLIATPVKNFRLGE